MNRRTVWEIDVPIEHRLDKTRKGVRVFTSLAASGSDALASALRACEIAQMHAMSGQPIPAGTSRGDWSARGLRPDWKLRWDRAEKKQIVL
ncbi:hypothetical protein QFZ82_007638 [Streptomyces sp. V4I23]|uniref:hypothetical protein n=1 Tax=Streptomyces sp. V4I23 TaxID=3042282 RepID=UPI00278838F8|nr:hypothetical protein [Streptomyces sp. V4I23]MDQ1013153.1 hypothetical protein [Streptomyces sp. V4I23]